jgi:hypothetical protein
MANRHAELVNSCTFTRFSKFLAMEIEQNRFLYVVDSIFEPVIFKNLTVLFESKESENNTKKWDPSSAHIL